MSDQDLNRTRTAPREATGGSTTEAAELATTLSNVESLLYSLATKIARRSGLDIWAAISDAFDQTTNRPPSNPKGDTSRRSRRNLHNAVVNAGVLNVLRQGGLDPDKLDRSQPCASLTSSLSFYCVVEMSRLTESLVDIADRIRKARRDPRANSELLVSVLCDAVVTCICAMKLFEDMSRDKSSRVRARNRDRGLVIYDRTVGDTKKARYELAAKQLSDELAKEADGKRKHHVTSKTLGTWVRERAKGWEQYRELAFEAYDQTPEGQEDFRAGIAARVLADRLKGVDAPNGEMVLEWVRQRSRKNPGPKVRSVTKRK